ncbi:class I SAM-dependent methyltransferase [Nocardiopsis sp. RSe5-2]|uniref:Class I SAM-dependent methyltransferase n=1 Tax=Nocardiopsis endophytica TaxID=3018445 RepID=A0ABT4U369_9ACTN|nr:class I SAM-dependent methyltransferase [Nocardiopsis endophytica]MDA2810919.1 class I SAM-dependent methyltransferase [Nocardiopsis endophytica]
MTQAVHSDMAGIVPPRVIEAEECARREDYELSSSRETGALLRVLAASKPGGRILELGTGVGVGAAWILDGMTPDARLDTVEVHEEACAFASGILAGDERVEVHCADTREWMRANAGAGYDLIFADAGHPKFYERDLTVGLLAPGGILLADDLLPQPKWVDEHPRLVGEFRSTIHEDERLATVMVDWASGLALSVRR